MNVTRLFICLALIIFEKNKKKGSIRAYCVQKSGRNESICAFQFENMYLHLSDSLSRYFLALLQGSVVTNGASMGCPAAKEKDVA